MWTLLSGLRTTIVSATSAKDWTDILKITKNIIKDCRKRPDLDIPDAKSARDYLKKSTIVKSTALFAPKSGERADIKNIIKGDNHN